MCEVRAERAGWEILLETVTLDLKGGQHSVGASTLVVHLVKAFEKVPLSVCGHGPYTFSFRKECDGFSVDTSLMKER